MTTPSQPTHVPPVLPPSPAQQEAEQVAVVAGRIVRARKYLSTTLKTTVPAAATGAAVALIVSRRKRSEIDDVKLDVPSDYTDNE